MTLFRGLLMLMIVTVALYTAMTISNHGWNLLPIFFGDMKAMAWPGQFNLDFMCMLFLSGSWVMWRHGFNGAGIGLGIVAFFGGILFLAPYLLYHSFKTGGDMRAVLLGSSRV